MPFKSDKQRKWMYANKPDVAKKWEKKYALGGKLHGPAHTQGGIPIEAEGGEYIIKKKSVNKLGDKVLDYINKHGKLPK
jgi:hypothetical protein